MKDIKPQDIWWVDFPYDDIENSKIRPVIVLRVFPDSLEVLSLKLTSKQPRVIDKIIDEYEVPIFNWQEAKLRYPSVARISKVQLISSDKFLKKICTVADADWKNIERKLSKYLTERT